MTAITVLQCEAIKNFYIATLMKEGYGPFEMQERKNQTSDYKKRFHRMSFTDCRKLQVMHIKFECFS